MRPALRVLLAVAVGAVALVVHGAAPASADRCSASDPFTATMRAEVTRRWAGHHITAEVYDTRTGCRYRLEPQHRVTTASVLKIELMAGTLLRAQQQGRGLTNDERSLIAPMISTSADPPASTLWSRLGGVAGMRSLDATFELHDTTPAQPWGLTRTSAHDQVELIRQVIFGEYGPLSASSRAEARRFMEGVVPSQRWGITAGVPAGWSVPLKNGFFSSQCCRWRVNTSGAVLHPDGGGYAITILSDGWSSLEQGVPAVEHVSRAVAGMLTGPVTTRFLCDWDGDGIDTPGIRVGRTTAVWNTLDGGSADSTFSFGRPSDRAVCGDWDGDGADSIGVVRGATWHLRNASSPGPATATFRYGRPTDWPLAGDWDGDGIDTPGAVRANAWYLTDAAGGGPATRSFVYGRPTDRPVVGDWDGDGVDAPGMTRGRVWYLNDRLGGGAATRSFAFGRPTDLPVTGDWSGAAHTSVGVVRGAVWYLRDQLSEGPATATTALAEPR